MKTKLSSQPSAFRILLALAAVVAIATSCSSSSRQDDEQTATSADAVQSCTSATVWTWLPFSMSGGQGTTYGSIQVPQTLPTWGQWVGNATATLTFSTASGVVTCTYYAHGFGQYGSTQFTLASCSNGTVYGQYVVSSGLSLGIEPVRKLGPCELDVMKRVAHGESLLRSARRAVVANRTASSTGGRKTAGRQTSQRQSAHHGGHPLPLANWLPVEGASQGLLRFRLYVP